MTLKSTTQVTVTTAGVLRLLRRVLIMKSNCCSSVNGLLSSNCWDSSHFLCFLPILALKIAVGLAARKRVGQSEAYIVCWLCWV